MRIYSNNGPVYKLLTIQLKNGEMLKTNKQLGRRFYDDYPGAPSYGYKPGNCCAWYDAYEFSKIYKDGFYVIADHMNYEYPENRHPNFEDSQRLVFIPANLIFAITSHNVLRLEHDTFPDITQEEVQAAIGRTHYQFQLVKRPSIINALLIVILLVLSVGITLLV